MARITVDRRAKCSLYAKISRFLTLLTIVQGHLPTSSATATGFIWSKSQKVFLPISDVPGFRAVHREAMIKVGEREKPDLYGRVMRFTFFQERNVVEFYDNDTKVTGLVGEIWSTLSTAMNFTLRPVKSNIKTIGVTFPNGSCSGLLNVIQQNGTDILGGIETYAVRLAALDFTMPLWKSRHRLFIPPDHHYNPTWMVKIFSWRVWCATIMMHIILTICGFLSKKVFARAYHLKENVDHFGEHIFYNFAMICNQSYIPPNFRGRSRGVEISLAVFSYLLYIAYSTLLFGYLSKTTVIPPFTDISTLMSETSYTIVTLEGSLLDLAYQNRDRYKIGKPILQNRFRVVPKIEDLYAMCCLPTKSYAMFEEEYLQSARDTHRCSLHPVGQSYFDTWISSGLIKGFEQKKAIDIGILKLYEFGIMKSLKNRWLAPRDAIDLEHKPLEGINIEQVCVIIAVFFTGVGAACLLLIIEIFLSHWPCNQTHKQIKKCKSSRIFKGR